MQQYLRAILKILTAILTAWVLILIVSRQFYFHTNVDPSLTGNIKMSDTDIDDQCGVNTQSNERIEYKLTPAGQLVYLCPLHYWPIQKQVTALTLSTEFRNSLSTEQAKKISTFYPEATSALNTSVPAGPMVSIPLI